MTWTTQKSGHLRILLHDLLNSLLGTEVRLIARRLHMRQQVQALQEALDLI